MGKKKDTGVGAMSHTPGPWRYARSGYGSRVADFDIVGDQGGRVASTPYEDKARLIAAAPDLLAALRSLLRFAECADQERIARNFGTEFDTSEHSAISAARTAIARAEGK